MIERAFLMVLSRVIGLKFLGGPFGLPGLGIAINSPELMWTRWLTPLDAELQAQWIV